MPELESAGDEVVNPAEAAAPGAAAVNAGESPSGKVEPKVVRHGESEKSFDKPYNAYQAELRFQRKVLDRLERLETFQKEQFKPKTYQPPSVGYGTNGQSDDFWANPQESLARMLEERDQKLFQQLNQSREQERQVAQQHQSLAVADEYLAKLGEFTPQDFAEMRDIVEELPEIAQLAVKSPERAARSIYAIWAQEHGLNTSSVPRSTPARPSKIQASGIQGAIAGTGQKQWTAEEIRKVAGTPKYAEYRDQIRASIAGLAR